jgi:HNH endonuclease
MHEQLPSQLSDPELVAEVARLAGSERRMTASLIAHLAELDTRRLHLRAGFPSLFVYCTQVLQLSEGGAYNRIVAARAARRFPAALEQLAEGVLNLGTLRLIAPHLTQENRGELFALAAGKGKREVEESLARRFPRPDVVASVRKLPAHKGHVGALELSAPSVPARELELGGGDRESGGGLPVERSDRPGGLPGVSHAAAPAVGAMAGESVSHGERPFSLRHPVITPLAADRYQFRFTGGPATRDKLRRAQDLLRHTVPSGDPGEIFDRALTALLKDLERKKFAASDKPRGGRGSDSGSRAIPAAVRRAVSVRDGRRCAFVAETGRRCGATALLEFHHVVPYASGGPPSEANIQLRCRAHNSYEAELDFGRCQLVPGQVAAGRDARGGEPSGDWNRRTIPL